MELGGASFVFGMVGLTRWAEGRKLGWIAMRECLWVMGMSRLGVAAQRG